MANRERRLYSFEPDVVFRYYNALVERGIAEENNNIIRSWCDKVSQREPIPDDSVAIMISILTRYTMAVSSSNLDNLKNSFMRLVEKSN